MEYIIGHMCIEVRNLNFSHDDNFLLKDLSFRIDNKEIGYIVGGSGSGKSSLFNIISGLKKPDSGEIICNKAYFNNVYGWLSRKYTSVI